MKRIFVGAIAALLVSVSCGEDVDSFIDGSLADGYDMEFDDVRARLYSAELSIEFIRNGEQGEKIPLRITLDRSKATVMAGKSYDLMQFGTISRGNGYDAALPPLTQGNVMIDEYEQTQKAVVSGSFDGTFTMPDGSKKTLRGAFRTGLELVGI